MAQAVRNLLDGVPLEHRLWSPNELIERNQERSHPFDAAELMPALSPELRHHPWRALRLLHQLEQQHHCLVDFSFPMKMRPLSVSK
jgi:hypothetical protein